MRRILCFVWFVLRAQGVPDHPFIPPNGPYAVGVHEFLWVDQNRDERFTQDPNDRRHVLARIWYPAEKSLGLDPAPYIYDSKEFGEGSFYKQLTGVKTNSFTDAPMAKKPGRFPVLLYQPGGGMARFTATFVTEQLASHGYVVVSCDHAGFGPVEMFPDGYKFKADALLAPKPTGKLENDALESWAWLRKDIFPTWTGDASFALDQIEVLNRTPGQRFYKRLDVSRIGMLGWSFGGATSVQMSKDDRRVKAVIDQDGQLFGDVAAKGTPKPLMLMHHGMVDTTDNPADQPTMVKLMHQVEEQNRSLLDHSTGDRYEVTLAGTQHGHFSDLLLPHPPAGQLDPRRAHEIILAYTLAFFDKYLNGRDNSLLTAPASPYPEVTFRRLAAGKPGSPGPDNREADARALREGEVAAFVKDWGGKDADRMAAHFADDGNIILPNSPMLTGKDAIGKAMKGGLTDPNWSLALQPVQVEISRGGDLGYTRGTYVLTATDPAIQKAVTEKGRFVTIFRKEANGSWKAVQHINNTEAPATSK